MKILEYLNTLLFDSSIHLSIQGAIVVLTSMILLNTEINIFLLIIAFFSTYFAYSINRITDVEEDMINRPARYQFYRKYGKFFYFIAILFYIISIGLSYYFFDLRIILILLIPLLLGIFYSIKIIPENLNTKYRRIKDIPGGKNIVIGLAWGSLTFLTIYYNPPLTPLLFLFCFFFIRTFMNTIAFDIRDIDGDRKVGIKTIPTLFGINVSLLTIHFSNIISFIILLYAFLLKLLPNVILTIGIISFSFTILYTKLIKTNLSRKIIFDLLIDSEDLIILMIVLLYNYL